MRYYEITFKEVGKDKPRKTTFSGPKTREQVIEFYGLEEPDVEWYDIVEVFDIMDITV